MSKSSKPCKYTGHMHSMNKENNTNSSKANSCPMQQKSAVQNCHHKMPYPEEKNKCNQCSCKNK